ncbi:16S rRNA (cytidine1402-2'-O)-methyltransferase [Desulfovibrionales bacterium]
MSSIHPALWVVATPLGNPGDLSPRAREVLSTADMILCEDTRRTGRLLHVLGIVAGRLQSLHEYNEVERIPNVIALLAGGVRVALVSDAGTPLLSDPGYRLVRACREAGLRVVPIPGPSAITTLLMAAGLPPYPFMFFGFLPRGRGERQTLFAAYAWVPVTLVFFERKSRLADSLEVAYAVMGPREFCIGRELTKIHEEFIFGRLGRWEGAAGELLGEITVAVGPLRSGSVVKERMSESVVDAAIRFEAVIGGSLRDIAGRVRSKAPGWTSKELYQRVWLLAADQRGKY